MWIRTFLSLHFAFPMTGANTDHCLSTFFALSIVRTLIDYFSEIPNTLPLQIEVCKETIQWTIQEKRIFLKQALETRLIALYLDNKMYSDSLALVGTLLKELKKLDDKMVLVEVQLLESRVCHALRNLPKAKVRITIWHFGSTSILSDTWT